MDADKYQLNMIIDKKDEKEFKVIQKEYKRSGRLVNILFHEMLTIFIEKHRQGKTLL